MKKDIHPKYYPNSKVHCACGNRDMLSMPSFLYRKRKDS